MATELPEWFIQKYSVHKGVKMTTPVEAPKKQPLSLYRQYLNEEFGPLVDPPDTQQERERLKGQDLASVRQPIDPDTLRRLADRFAQGPDELIIDVEPKKTEVLNITPVRPVPEFEKGKKVFTDQKKLDDIIAEAPEEGRVVSFKDAFKQARNVGLENFEYKGNLFNTREKGETESSWLSTLRKNKVAPLTNFVEGFVRERRIEDIPEFSGPSKGIFIGENPREQSRKYMSLEAHKQSQLPEVTGFAKYMKQNEVKVAKGKKVDISSISEKLGPALDKVSPMFKKADITPEITSGKRNLKKWSLHEVGEAIDLRLKTANEKSLEKLKKELPGKPIKTFIEGESGEMWSDGTYEYVIHGKGNNIHLHIERETEESKKLLAEHMVELGLKNKISKKSLKRYPNLLKKYFPEPNKLKKVN